MDSAADRIQVSQAKISMCGKGRAFLEKYLRVTMMGIKPAENGEPEVPSPMAGSGKFERRVWERASYRQTEIAHASSADSDTSASTWGSKGHNFADSTTTFYNKGAEK